MTKTLSKRRWLGILVIFTVLLFQLPTGYATANSDVPKISIESCELELDSTTSLSITAQNIPPVGLAGYKISIFYNPQEVEVLKVERLSGDGFIAPMVKFETGRVQLVAAQAKAVAGNITLTHLRIKAKSTLKVVSPLTISLQEMVGGDLRAIIAVPENGNIQINGQLPEQPAEPSQPEQSTEPNQPEQTTQEILPLSLNLIGLPDAVVGNSYHYSLEALNGTKPYEWSATDLPGGLQLNKTTGAITGKPSSGAESSLVTIAVTDASSPQQSVSAQLSLSVNSSQSEVPSSSGQSGESGNTTPIANKPNSPQKQTQSVRAGTDRYDTSQKIALAHYFTSGSKSVLVANGYAPADALAGAPLAYKLKAPIILATKEASGADSLNSYLTTTKTTGGKLTLLGGTSVLDSTFEEVSPTVGTSQRLGGANRRETAISIAKELIGDSKNAPVVIVNENGFVDAISIAPIASVKGWPILLTNGNELSAETAKYLDDVKPSSIIIIGGQSVVSKAVFDTLSTKTQPNAITRLGGTDRFETNSLVLQAFAANTEKVAFANGDSDDVIDALAGAALGIPIVLVHQKDQLTSSQKVFLHQIGQVQSEIFGGSKVIAQTILWD